MAGRLGGEFHIRLAKLSGNVLLERYMSELVTRCSLILAVYGAPHTHDHGGPNEHSAIIDALRAGDAARAVAIMDVHMAAVERRALHDTEPSGGVALGAVLSRYAGAIAGRDSAIPLKRKRAK